MNDRQPEPSYASPQPHDAHDETGAEKLTLELCFMLAVGAILAAAFLRALTYDAVAARPPIVILIPLLVLVALRIRGLWAATRSGGIKRAWHRLARGENRQYARAAELFAWILLLLAFVYLGGHYAGITVFMFLMMRGVCGESTFVAAAVSIGVAVALFLLFELAFEIELYRGQIYRIWAGYDVS